MLLKSESFQGVQFMSSILELPNKAGVSWKSAQATGTRGRRIT